MAQDRSLPPEQLSWFLSEGVTDYAFVTFDVNARITSWSKGAERILGFTESEMIGELGDIIFTPEDRATAQAQNEIDTAYREGRAEDERWHMRKDQSRFWGSGVMTSIRDHTGKHVGYAKVMRDLTARRRAEEELRASQRQFQAVANLVPDLLWTNDADGRVTWHNQRWLEYSGQRVERGFEWRELIHPDDLKTTEERFAETLRPGPPYRHEMRLRRHDGMYRWFLAQAEPVHGEAGETLHWFGAATDIHEQRQELDVAKEELRALASQLITMEEDEHRGIARELHDSLGQQLGVLQTELAQVNGASSLERRVAAIAEEVRELSHRLHPSILEDLGLSAALRSLAEEFERAHGVPVRVEIERGLTTAPPAIKIALYRIAQEALRNVQKHAGPGACVSMTLHTGEELRLTIEDTGPGFAMDVPRARAGLGLVSMRERARTAGGTLQIHSSPGAGTRVEASIPRPRTARPSGKPRVVIADDHEASRYILRKFASLECEIVAEVQNGLEAIQEAERLRPELAILDVSMPVLNGVEAARLLRSRLPEIRVIFASQHTKREYVDEVFRAGAHGYIVKQAAATEMAEAIREVLSGRTFRSQLTTR